MYMWCNPDIISILFKLYKTMPVLARLIIMFISKPFFAAGLQEDYQSIYDNYSIVVLCKKKIWAQ